MVMLADLGAFRGNLSDLCRYFSVDPQTRNRNQLRTAINELVRHGYIQSKRTGNTYQMTIVPKEEEITMPAEWVRRIRCHEYHTENVAWEIVLKVQLWLIPNAKNIITNKKIAKCINISASQVVAAMNVLKNEFQAFVKEYAYWNVDNCFLRRGQVVDLSAWWS